MTSCHHHRRRQQERVACRNSTVAAAAAGRQSVLVLFPTIAIARAFCFFFFIFHTQPFLSVINIGWPFWTTRCSNAKELDKSHWTVGKMFLPLRMTKEGVVVVPVGIIGERCLFGGSALFGASVRLYLPNRIVRRAGQKHAKPSS